ncbi:siderophore ABC transporter substrate-binding protein [Rhizobium sp. FKL33]|uniref:siderophore ABC transporter substrate-binding protein n=1 Tax=Rhizobium sp. FKL33 TaxID=2562307 RepID=UPI0010C13DD2|nr:siderophore ABC transporter substrate-binding protein [Rhizobium sp. FKL33]
MSKSGFMRRAMLAALFGAVLTGGAPIGSAIAEPIEVRHFQGTTTLEGRPSRVFVYDLGILDMLDALDVPVRGVPGSNVPLSLSKYKADSYVKIGTLFEPDYETVNAEKPDLILIGPRTSEKYAALSALAPVVDLTADSNHFLDSVETNARTLGKIFGKEAEVEADIAALGKSINDLRSETKTMGNGLVILATGGKISAYGPKSRFGELHAEFGIAPADPNLAVAVHGQAISFEYILEVNPDWLFVIDRDAAVAGHAQTADKLLDNELVRRTRAWATGRVVYLDPVKMYLTSSSLRSQQGIVDELIAAIRQKSKS